MLLQCVRIVVQVGQTPSSPTLTEPDHHANLSSSINSLDEQHPNPCYTLDVPKSVTVKDVKDQLHRLIGAPNYLIRVFYRAVELKNHWNLYFIPSNESVLFTVSSPSAAQCHLQLCGPQSFCTLPMFRQRRLLDALRDAQEGINSGLKPLLSMEGSGGTYFLRGTDKRKVACFKPRDEEPSAPNNPRGLVGSMGSPSLREGILSGEATAREVACFLLDRGGFCGVPPTALVEAVHPGFSYNDLQAPSLSAGNSLTDRSSSDAHMGPYPKVGSLQLFVDADDFASDLSPSLFSASEVHKIALLDIRMLNCDRNDANILVKRCKKYNMADRCTSCRQAISMRSRCGSMDSVDSLAWGSSSSPRMPMNSSQSSFSFEVEDGANDFLSMGDSLLGGDLITEHTSPCTCSYQDKYFLQLTPIDHGYCLPSKIQIAWWDWCWFDWSQTDVPFGKEARQWVKNLDPDADADLLRQELNIREECLRMMKVSTLLLKKAVKAGLVLREIAHLIARNEVDEPSVLECQIQRAHELALLMSQNTRVKGHCRSNGSGEWSTATLSSATSTQLHDTVTHAENNTNGSPPTSPTSRRTAPRHSVHSFVPIQDNEDENRQQSRNRLLSSPQPLMRVQSFQEGKLQPKFKDNTHKVIRVHGTPMRVSDAKEKTGFGTSGTGDSGVVPLIAGQERKQAGSSDEELLDSYFFAYYERLIGDVIDSVLKHSPLDPSLRVYGYGDEPEQCLPNDVGPCNTTNGESGDKLPSPTQVTTKNNATAVSCATNNGGLTVDTDVTPAKHSSAKQGLSYSLRGYVSPRIVPSIGASFGRKSATQESPTQKNAMEPMSLPSTIVETVQQAKQSVMNSFRTLA